MKENKWADFFGCTLAASTLCVTACSANRMRKKYGEPQDKMFFGDIQYLGSYAVEKFVFSNPKVLNWLDQKFHLSDL